MAERLLDVRELPAPEPFERIVAALPELSPGDYLRVLHRREPFPLYAALAELGYEYRTTPGADAPFEIAIWRGDDRAAATAAEDSAP